MLRNVQMPNGATFKVNERDAERLLAQGGAYDADSAASSPAGAGDDRRAVAIAVVREAVQAGELDRLLRESGVEAFTMTQPNPEAEPSEQPKAQEPAANKARKAEPKNKAR